MGEKNSIAIITARGGSKRIPGKNIRDFLGKPIIAYSIEAAIKSGIFSEVMVSTDSKEIAQISEKYGANVPFMRSKKTSDDFATTSDVLLEVIDDYAKLGKYFDYICCIYPTAVFVTPEKLKEAMKIMRRNQANEVMPVVKFSYPPQRCFKIDEDGSMSYKYGEYVRSRSQDLEPLYHDAGQFYIYDSKVYCEKSGCIYEGITPIIVSDMEVQDIDNEEDWKMAELKYRLMS